MRRLEVTFAGYWYTALTIALGVVALLSSNNVLYLIESLLLSGMIFSGVLSERSISAVEIEFRRSHVFAKTSSQDFVRLKNRRKFSLFCVEVGEWRDGKFVCAAFVPKLGPSSELVVPSKLQFEQRGRYEWEGLAIATSYPFGLAKKVKIIDKPGERLIWPEKGAAGAKSAGAGDRGASIRSGQEFSEGEVRAYTFEDDCRNIIWTLSEKGMGPLVRTRKSRQTEPRVVLDLRCEPGAAFEKSVVQAARHFHRHEEGDGTLTLIDSTGTRVFRGRIAALNQLAIVQASPSPKARKKVA